MSRRTDDPDKSLNIEYYQPTFQSLTSIKSGEINKVLIEHPRELRKHLCTKLGIGTHLSGPVGYALLQGYLESIETEIRRLLKHHSVAYWVHMYRRIGPYLSPLHESKTDANTLGLVRDHVECAIAKYGILTGRRDIRRSSEVSPGVVLGGRFLRLLKSLIPERRARESYVGAFVDSDQLVLVEFQAQDFVDIYAVEGLCYEYWMTAARLRALGKGDELVVSSATDLTHVPNPEIDFLITSFDSRIAKADSFTAIVGTFVGRPDPLGVSTTIVAPSYNVTGERAEELVESLGFEVPTGIMGSALNFLPQTISIEAYCNAHEFLAQEFFRRKQYSLKDFLLVVAALTWRAMFPEKQFLKVLRGDRSAVLFSMFNLLRRAYVMIDPDLESIRGSVIWYLESIGDHDVSKSISGVLEGILSDLSLDTAERQSAISLWSRGPRAMLIKSNGFTMLDTQGVSAILRTLFVRLRHSGADRGVAFEDALRVELVRHGANLLPERILTFPAGRREVDAAVRVGDTLWVVEAHSMERPLDFEIGKQEVIERRNEQFAAKLDQAFSLRELLEAHPVGSGYDVSWANRIEHCVVSPFVEWIWATSPDLWVDNKTPRILSVSELLRLIKAS